MLNTNLQSGLFGIPEGWPPLLSPKNWNPIFNSIKGEPLSNDVYNPEHLSMYTFHPMFESRGGKYICHAMPAGLCPFPVNNAMGKREEGEYKFFYNGWK